MIREYIDTATRKATYEILPEDKSYYGEIGGVKISIKEASAA
jgi:hypothetical protein